jgi:hypothetical protein
VGADPSQIVKKAAEALLSTEGGQIDRNFKTLHGFTGPLEVIGGTLIIFGLRWLWLVTAGSGGLSIDLPASAPNPISPGRSAAVSGGRTSYR